MQRLLHVTPDMRENETGKGSVRRRKCIPEKSLLRCLVVFDVSIPEEQEITPLFYPGFVRSGKCAFFGG